MVEGGFMRQVRHVSPWKTLDRKEGDSIHGVDRMSRSRRQNFLILILVFVGMWSPSGKTWASDGGDSVLKGSENKPPSAATPATSPASAAAATATAATPQDLADMTESQKRAQELKSQGDWLELHLQACLPKLSAKAAIYSCAEGNLTTSKMCLESWSPAIKEVIPQLHLIGSAISMVSGMQQKCEQASRGYQLLQGALTAYQAMCAGSQISCKNSCKSAFQNLQQVSKALASKIVELQSKQPVDTVTLGKCQAAQKEIAELQNLANDSVAACDKYKMQLAGAAIGGAQLILAMSKSKECEEQTSAKPDPDNKPDCNKTPNDPRCVDCSKPQYQNHQTCICMQNPRAQGCQGHQVVTTPPNQGGNIGTPDPSTGGGGLLNPGTGNDTLAGPASLNAGNTPSGGGFGGGGMGGGSGALANQPIDKQKGIDGKSPSGPQVFESSGSGGLGRGGLLGRAGGLGDNPYSRFLPGGAEDPNKKDGDRALASVAGQITGKNGLSNFEKVKIRYQENRASLINQ